MTRRPPGAHSGDAPVDAPSHPLDGVLDRLLDRERGVEPKEASSAVERDPSARRMVVVPGVGPDRGARAVASVAGHAAERGRSPVVIEVGVPPSRRVASGGGVGDTRSKVPLARLNGPVERLWHESSTAVRAVLERLRRHEASGDLLIARIDPRSRAVLMRGALLAGGLALPASAEREVGVAALRLARDVAEAIVDLAVFAVADDSEVESFRALAADALVDPPRPLEALFSGGLLPPPEEGFCAALLSPDAAPDISDILEFGVLSI